MDSKLQKLIDDLLDSPSPRRTTTLRPLIPTGNVRYFSEGAPFKDYDAKDLDQEYPWKDEEVKGSVYDMSEEKISLTDEELTQQLERNQRIKYQLDQFWHQQKLYYEDLQHCDPYVECTLNGQLRVKNADTSGTIFANSHNLQVAISLHMKNVLLQYYPYFVDLEALHVDFQLKATHTVLDFKLVFYRGSRWGKTITNLKVKEFLEHHLSTRFLETYGFKPEDLKIGKELFT